MNLKSIYRYIVIYSFWVIFQTLFSLTAYSKTTLLTTNDLVCNNSDSIMQNDSTLQQLPKEYQQLKEKSSKNRWTKELFSLLIKEPRVKVNDAEENGMLPDYDSFKGKIIRQINIIVLSPLGTSIADPEQKSEKWKFLNDSHVLTREATVKKSLQFKTGSELNPVLLMASEAQLRNAQYIYDARIMVDSITSSNDSVDVKVIVRDKWTIGMDIHRLSTSNVNLEIFDGNILGSGSRAGLYFIYANDYKRKFGYGFNYLYENVANTNIDLGGEYVDKVDAYEVSVSAVRALQPKLNVFGEISYEKKVFRSDAFILDSIAADRRETFSMTLGRAFTLSQDNSIRRFVLSLRYRSKKNTYKNPILKDYVEGRLLPYKYVNNKIVLMQASLYENSYRREFMVYNFGTTEDIAEGYNISTQFGYSYFDNINNAAYSSLSMSYGTNKIVKGNMYVSSSISSFFDKKNSFGGVFKFDAKYFTPLIFIAGHQFRQFLTLDYSKLLDPDRYLGDNIYMGEHTTMKVKDWRNGIKGTQQFLFKSETDFFSRYQILGFRVLFYNFLDLGWITSGGKMFASDNFNYGFGGGIRLRNNFIIFNTINLKLGFYPKLNQEGFGSFFKVGSSTPNVSPDFIPKLPQEIVLE